MKNYFTIGLMALTLAFGVTSCDKQDNIGGGSVNALSPEAQLVKSEVSFGLEDMGIGSPKGYINLTAKNQGEFPHRYATTSNTLVISDAGVTPVWTGEYIPNNTSTLVGTGNFSTPIILADNVEFNVAVDNVSNSPNTDIVLDYLPYRATATFTLPRTDAIQLNAELLRGFVIVNAQAEAAIGNRITGVTIGGADLLKDSDGDYYGYLLAGDYNVVVTYNLNTVSKSFSASQTVALGLGYTIELDLTADTLSPSTRTISSTVSLREDALSPEQAAAYTSDDADLYDILDVTTITTFTTPAGGVEEAGVITYSFVVTLPQSQADIDGTVPGTDDGNADADTVAPSISLSGATTGTVDIDYIYTVVPGEENTTIVWSKNGTVVSGENGLTYTTSFSNANGVKSISVTVTDEAGNEAVASIEGIVIEEAAITYDVREYSTYADYANELEDFVQNRTVTNAEGATFDPQINAESLSRNVVVTPVTVPAIIGTPGSITYTATVDNIVIGTHVVVIPALPANIVDAWFDANGAAVDTAAPNGGIITNATYPTKGYSIDAVIDATGNAPTIVTINFYVDGSISDSQTGSTAYADNHSYAQGEIVNGNQ